LWLPEFDPTEFAQAVAWIFGTLPVVMLTPRGNAWDDTAREATIQRQLASCKLYVLADYLGMELLAERASFNYGFGSAEARHASFADGCGLYPEVINYVYTNTYPDKSDALRQKVIENAVHYWFNDRKTDLSHFAEALACNEEYMLDVLTAIKGHPADDCRIHNCLFH